MIFFFFSSRRRHTRWNCDWSSDVCSSDLDFDRDKLMGSMMLALRKRPVATDEVEGAVDRVIERLRSLGEREVPTTRVGDFVIRELAKLDKIAYIRFASVYRSFETPDDFREAVQEVKSARKRRR